MSTIDREPLGGFEERLLTQLKTHVATRPVDAYRPETRAVVRGHLVHLLRARSMLVASAVVVAILVAVVTFLPKGQTALAQAFPILTQRPERLPAGLERILRTQRLPESTQSSDRELAYAFRAPSGIGYVVVDERQKWICLLLPGLGTGNGNVLCETAARLLVNRPRALRLIGEHRGSEDIVELLPKGSTATLISTHSARSIALHDGILTIDTHQPVSITTTVDGRTTTTTYDASDREASEH